MYLLLDIDECLVAAVQAVDVCVNVTNSQCVNTEGSFECICVPGYIVVNETCERELHNIHESYNVSSTYQTQHIQFICIILDPLDSCIFS